MFIVRLRLLLFGLFCVIKAKEDLNYFCTKLCGDVKSITAWPFNLNLCNTVDSIQPFLWSKDSHVCSNMSCFLLFWFNLTSEKLILVRNTKWYWRRSDLRWIFSFCFWGIRLFLCSTACVFYKESHRNVLLIFAQRPLRSVSLQGGRAEERRRERPRRRRRAVFRSLHLTSSSQITKSSRRISYCQYLQIPQRGM